VLWFVCEILTAIPSGPLLAAPGGMFSRPSPFRCNFRPEFFLPLSIFDLSFARRGRFEAGAGFFARGSKVFFQKPFFFQFLLGFFFPLAPGLCLSAAGYQLLGRRFLGSGLFHGVFSPYHFWESHRILPTPPTGSGGRRSLKRGPQTGFILL